MTKCKADLGETLSFNKYQLTGLYRKTFRPWPVNNFQRSLAWQSYYGASLVRDKLARDGYSGQTNCPRFWQSNEIALHAIMQCSRISETWFYAENLLSCVERVRLSSESIIKNVSPPSHSKERGCSIAVIATAKEVIWKSCLRSVATGDFLSNRLIRLINDFGKLKRKIRMKRSCLPLRVFEKKMEKI